VSVVRCSWAVGDPIMEDYHDTEWGVPLHDDRKLFEFIVLDLFQSGLSWRTILHKRAAFDAAFAHFEVDQIASFDDQDVARLMNDTGIVRNRLKVAATIANAKAVLKIRQSAGSLDHFLWALSDGNPVVNRFEAGNDVPAATEESTVMSRALKQEGMAFLGPVVCYAFMQGAGFVNDHLVSCFRYKELTN